MDKWRPWYSHYFHVFFDRLKVYWIYVQRLWFSLCYEGLFMLVSLPLALSSAYCGVVWVILGWIDFIYLYYISNNTASVLSLSLPVWIYIKYYSTVSKAIIDSVNKNGSEPDSNTELRIPCIINNGMNQALIITLA